MASANFADSIRPGGWAKFTEMLEEGREHRERTGKSLMVPRYDIVPIPEHLREGLAQKSVQISRATRSRYSRLKLRRACAISAPTMSSAKSCLRLCCCCMRRSSPIKLPSGKVTAMNTIPIAEQRTRAGEKNTETIDLQPFRRSRLGCEVSADFASGL